MTDGRRISGAKPRSAIGKSIDVYYRDAARSARMDQLNATLVGQDALVFDIGAHIGDRAGSFARLGAKVVALEPQPRVFRALRLIQGHRKNVTLLNEAVAAACGTMEMFINTANPTVSTASPDLIAAAQEATEWQGQKWDGVVEVTVTTVDQLVAEFGVPDFVKIDVEGFELEVLKGVSIALAALSFEFTTIQRDVSLACIDRLTQLGQYEFNFSLGENHKFVCQKWITPSELRAKITTLPASSNSGDIYARILDHF